MNKLTAAAMDTEATVTKSFENIERTLRIWNKAGEDVLKLVKKAKRDVKLRTRDKVPVSIPFHKITKKVTEKEIQTDMSFVESLTPEVIDQILALSVTDLENFQNVINNVVPKNVNDICSTERMNDNEKPQKSTTDTSLKRKITDENPVDLNENSDKTKVMKKTTDPHFELLPGSSKKLDDGNNNSTTNKTSKTDETNNAIKINVQTNDNSKTVEQFNKNSCEKSSEIDAPNNENPTAADQNDRGISVLDEIIQASENYKGMVNKLAISASRIYKSGKCASNKKRLDTVCDVFDKIVTLFLNSDEESAEENSNKTNSNETNSNETNGDETNLQTQSNNNSISIEMQINLLRMKQERDDVNEDDISTVISEVINRPETNTITEKQTEVSQIETIQLQKQQEQTQQTIQQQKQQEPTRQTIQQQKQQEQTLQIIQKQKYQDQTRQITSNTYNYFDKYNVCVNQNKNLQSTVVKETRPPCPPSTTPSLQQSHFYNNQSSYSNQEFTNKNVRHTNKRSHNRQTPYPRYPQQINQLQMQQIPHNQQTFVPYQQYIRQQNAQMQTQMPGMFPQNPPYH